MPIQILVARDYDHLSEIACELVAADCRERLGAKDEYVLGLATGGTPVGLYKHLAAAANADKIDAGRIRTFNLDEYVGLPGENAQQRSLHPASYSYFMIAELFGLLRRPFAQTHLPYGALIDQRELEKALHDHPGDWRAIGADSGCAIVIRPRAASPCLAWIKQAVLDDYPRKIARAGGVDLQVIGVGGRGHVAFHESGIPFNAGKMLLVKLDENTVRNAVADGHFASAADAPRFAVSMAASLVYSARTVLLLASGARKLDPVLRSLVEPPSTQTPISYGQIYAERGGCLIYVVDAVVGQPLLARRRELAKRGVEIVDRRRGHAKRRVESIAFYRDLASGCYRCR